MSTALLRRGARPRARIAARLTAAGVAGVVAIGAAAPIASATTGTAADGIATATVDDAVVVGHTIHVEGSGWLAPTAVGGGSVIAVKLDSLGIVSVPAPTNPVPGGPDPAAVGAYAAIRADADGTFEVDLPFPTATNTTGTGFDAAQWAVGTNHHVRLLTGSMLAGDTGRSVQANFTVVAEPTVATVTATAANGGRGAPAGSVTLTVSGSTFTEGEKPTVKVDGVDATWSTVPTVAADGSFSGRVTFAAGQIRAGSHAVAVSSATASATTTVTVTPSLTWTSLTQGFADQQLTIANLPDGSSVSAVTLGDVVFDLAAPVAANASGTAVVAYSIPAKAALGTLPVVITQTSPAATYTLTAKIAPSSATFGVDDFAVVQSPVLQQGLYQSAYSAVNDDLFVATASSTSTSRIYKLNPRTLKVRQSVQPAYVSGDSGPLWAAYGIAVDDTNNTVWVTNTRQNTVAVYDQDDLSLVKQFTTEDGLVSHSRDVIHDPKSDLVFVTSASEGASGDGYISVFDPTGDDGSPAFVKNIPTGPRSEFSPMSLEVDPVAGKLYSVSLQSPKAVEIDTATLEARFIPLGLPAGARASGVAYDALTKRLFVASQGVDGLLIADATTGATIASVPTGASALNVAFDPINRLLYISNFGGTTISVADADGNLVANLPFAQPNHVHQDGKGSVFAVNKAADNRAIRITPKAVTASVPTVTGTARVASTLTAHAGTWSTGAKVSYQWQRNGAAIAGATGATYKAVAADASKKLTVAVTGSLAGFASVTRTSAAVTVAPGVLTAPKPAVSGTAQVGKKLSAAAGTWTAGTKLAYQWVRSGAAIKGATASSYTLVAADKGKAISVKVTGSLSGYSTASVSSKATSAVKAGTLTAAKPKISGTAKVGKKLTVSPGSWTSGTALTYRWYANGKAISGKTAKSLTLSKSLAGKKITVKVTGSKAGYTTVTTTSSATKAVKK